MLRILIIALCVAILAAGILLFVRILRDAAQGHCTGCCQSCGKTCPSRQETQNISQKKQ